MVKLIGDHDAAVGANCDACRTSESTTSIASLAKALYKREVIVAKDADAVLSPVAHQDVSLWRDRYALWRLELPRLIAAAPKLRRPRSECQHIAWCLI